MEILIKGMDMPETCIDCPLHDGEYGQCNINHNIYISFDDRPRKCPLIEINSHYLIDANLPSAQPERSLWFRIGEICVDESKGFISAERAVEKIRELLREGW